MRRANTRAAAGILLLGLLILLANGADSAADMIRERLRLCADTLIPSLFGCMLLAELLCRSGAGERLGAHLRLFGRAVGLSPALTGIFLVSQLAGYPAGAMLLRREAECGRISQQDAGRLACAAYGGGPAFLVGLCGVQLFGSAAAGWVMLAACILANCAAVRILRPRETVGAVPETVRPGGAELLTGSAAQTVSALMQICGVVLCFGLISWTAERLGVLRLLTSLGAAAGLSAQTVRALFAALLDVTQLTGLLHCGMRFSVLLPLAAGMLSFGGICVQVQCIALGVRGQRFAELICVRLLTAILAALLTAAAVPFLPMPAEIPAFAQRAAISQTGSVLPAVMILLTGFPVFLCNTGAHGVNRAR